MAPRIAVGDYRGGRILAETAGRDMSDDTGAIHIFFQYLSPVVDKTSYEFLSPDDRQRLALIRHERRRRQFVAGRALLGMALADLFGSAARRWRLEARTGPLHLEGDQAPQISLTHSHDIVACAVAPVPVGLDVEYCRDRDIAALVEYVCSETERRAYGMLPAEDRKAWFYRLWTTKEATYKALGGNPFPDVWSAERRWLAHSESLGFQVRDTALQRASLELPEGFVGTIVIANARPIRLQMHELP
jgi:4'-phosphopantetheinyl transferase